MKISNIKKKGNCLEFVLEDVNVAFANALRRIMISEVPVLAIDTVTFFENSSALYDEVISSRLGLLPIVTDLRTFKLPEECRCKGKGCPKCKITFTLVKKGPGMVYSKDLKSSDTKTKVTDDNIPIVKLSENQKIKLEAVAVLGLGQTHAKWQPGVISYRYYPSIKINSSCNVCGKCVEECPRGVFTLKGKKLEITNLENCSLCNACVEICPKKAVEVKGIDNKFIFTIESHGALKPEVIAKTAAEVLERKAKEFEKALK